MTPSTFRFALAIAVATLGAPGGAAFAQTAQTDAGNVEITAPLNGWRNSAGDDSRYTQDVHYPAVSVSTPQGQGTASMIAGRIRNLPKAAAASDENKPRRRRGADGSSVGTLVVNGVAMPQRIEADGTFSRPYAFGAGSNSVEVRSARGDAKRVQFYDSYAGRPRPRLRVVLSWDTDGTDLDLHVVSPDGQHAWYGNRVAQNGGALDVDVTTGYGPEIYSNPAPPPGTYLVYVNYYGSGSDNSAITTATVTVITDESTPSERQQTFVVPMRKAGELTLVRTFTMK